MHQLTRQLTLLLICQHFFRVPTAIYDVCIQLQQLTIILVLINPSTTGAVIMKKFPVIEPHASCTTVTNNLCTVHVQFNIREAV
jgi:hypothetical protein